MVVALIGAGAFIIGVQATSGGTGAIPGAALVLVSGIGMLVGAGRRLFSRDRTPGRVAVALVALGLGLPSLVFGVYILSLAFGTWGI
jgi:hypothetical protein